jgi:hypothetical protein
MRINEREIFLEIPLLGDIGGGASSRDGLEAFDSFLSAFHAIIET